MGLRGITRGRAQSSLGLLEFTNNVLLFKIMFVIFTMMITIFSTPARPAFCHTRLLTRTALAQ